MDLVGLAIVSQPTRFFVATPRHTPRSVECASWTWASEMVWLKSTQSLLFISVIAHLNSWLGRRKGKWFTWPTTHTCSLLSCRNIHSVCAILHVLPSESRSLVYAQLSNLHRLAPFVRYAATRTASETSQPLTFVENVFIDVYFSY